ncbi:MAG TPA: hypothetical protein VH374_26295 [Polyangia bacterium]|jgi:hypothetical protein|nr:hypothetical protein [Polyangia bacterium]
MPYPRRLPRLGDSLTDLLNSTSLDPTVVDTTGITPDDGIDFLAPNGVPVLSQNTTVAPSSGSSFSQLFPTILTDVTNFFKPGTPTTLPTYSYSPSSPVGSALNNPWLWAIGAVGLYALAKGRR